MRLVISYLPLLLTLNLSESLHWSAAEKGMSWEQCLMLHRVKRTIITKSPGFKMHQHNALFLKKNQCYFPVFTSQIQDCGVFQQRHRVSGSAGVISCIFCPQTLYNIHRVVDMCVVAIEHPAEVCWWNRGCRALQCHSVSLWSCWRSNNWHVMWSNWTEKRQRVLMLEKLRQTGYL